MSNAIQPNNSTSICYQRYPEGSYIPYDTPSIGYTFAKSMPLIFSTGLLSKLSCGYLSVKGFVPTMVMSLVVSAASNFFATKFEELALQQARGRDPNWGGAFSFETEDLVYQNGTQMNFALAAGGAAFSAISNGKVFTHAANQDILKLESSLGGEKVSTLNAVTKYMSLDNKKQNLELQIKTTESLKKTLQGSLGSLSSLFQQHLNKLRPNYLTNQATTTATARTTDAAGQSVIWTATDSTIDAVDAVYFFHEYVDVAAPGGEAVIPAAAAGGGATAAVGGGANAAATAAAGAVANAAVTTTTAAAVGGGANAATTAAARDGAAANAAVANAAAGAGTRVSCFGRLIKWFRKAPSAAVLNPAAGNPQVMQELFQKALGSVSSELNPRVKQKLSIKFFTDFSTKFPYNAREATEFLDSIGREVHQEWKTILTMIDALELDPTDPKLKDGVKAMWFKIFSDRINLRQLDGQLASHMAQLTTTSKEILATLLTEGNSLGQVSSELKQKAKNWETLQQLQTDRGFTPYRSKDVIGKTRTALNKMGWGEGVFKFLEFGTIAWQVYNFVMEQFNFFNKLRDTCIAQVEANQ
jgi:hypothetical protein